MTVSHIGRCKGCDRAARLDDGVCRPCLERRGRGWAEKADRCRREPAFASDVYSKIKSVAGKASFIRMFGLPDGAEPPRLEPPPGPRLTVVK